jgi:hypothetical protein
MRQRNRIGVTLGAGVLAVAATLVPAEAASAAPGSFGVDTGSSPQCSRYGGAQFVSGDHSVGVYDACKDGVGVKAWVWISGKLYGAQRNGGGFNSEVWLPLPKLGSKDTVGIKVCAQDGPDGTPFACGSRTE